MALIRPCADLRNNYNEISRICHETKQPIYITKNGTNDLVVLCDETYENIIKKSQIDEEEKKILEQGQNEAVEAIKYWIKNGIDNTMNKYNKNS